MNNAVQRELPEAVVTVEIVDALEGGDMNDLCDATRAAIEENAGFGWLVTPGHDRLERYWQGVLVVPERSLLVARLDGVICGAVQLVEPTRHNEAQSFAATLLAIFVAPWARGHGAGRSLVEMAEKLAVERGFGTLNLDIRENQHSAISLYESLGFTRWGTNPHYARVDGKILAGHYYSKTVNIAALSEERDAPNLKRVIFGDG